MAVDFRLLGEFEARIDDRVVDVGHARQRSVLVALLVDANRVVTVDQLVERVWGDRQPAHTAGALYSYLSRLRRILGVTDDVGIGKRSGGYVLTADPLAIDLHRFPRLIAQAQATSSDQAAAGLYAQALALWRGDAFARLDTPWLNAVRDTLHQQRLAAELDRNDLELRLGRHTGLLGELSVRAAALPLDERLGGQLMLALYRCGRQADALELYQRTRQRLADDLGTDPGPALQRLHRQILTTDPALDVPVLAVRSAPRQPLSGDEAGIGPRPTRYLSDAIPARPNTGERDPLAGNAHPPPDTAPRHSTATAFTVPAQLPAAVAAFAGRDRELAHLDRLLSGNVGTQTVMVVSALSGTAGVGKTALAVHWAHRVAERFPDGQLYVNLRGFDPGGSVADPHAVVRVFLEGLGVPAERIPADLDAQVGLYRTVLAERRILVLLDNARDSDQVRPLLPGSAGSLAIVTSRRRLSSLVVNEGAHPITLALLTRAESTALLAGRLGADRVAAEPDAVASIVQRCTRLPLALAIAAARAAGRPAFPLARIADELRDPLDALHGDEPTSDARTVFSWSYRALSPAAARLFRLLGLHPGPEIDPVAAASLAALPVPTANALLTDLSAAHLIEEHTPGRYGLHDLLRAYAGELARSPETDAERANATDRMLDHYLYTAFTADRLLDPSRDPIELPGLRPGTRPARFDGADDAHAWFGREHAVLLALLTSAAQAGRDAYTISLTWTLSTFHNRRDLMHDWVSTHVAALSAAERTHDRRLRADAHRELGRVYTWAGRSADASTHLHRALELYDDGHHHAGRAYTFLYLSRLRAHEKCPADAIDHGNRALALFRAAGHKPGEARTLNALGWQHILVGQPRRALTLCAEALCLLEQTGDREGQAHTWDSLGYAHHHQGEYPDAARCFRQAFYLFEELGDRYHQADILVHLGDTHQAAGDHAAAEQARLHALRIFDELGHTQADRLRTQLAAATPRSSPAASIASP